MAALKPEEQPHHAEDGFLSRLTERFRELKLRKQLLIVYGLLSCFAFGALMGVCAFISGSVSDSIIVTASEELAHQVINNSKFVMRETGMVFDARLHDGFYVLVQPTAFALYELLGNDSHIEPLPSYADSSPQTLKPTLTVDPRYRCAANVDAAARGCDTDTGLQQISLGASSVYASGAPLRGSLPPPPPDTANAIMRSSVLDVYVKRAWARRDTWIDVFVSGLSTPSIYRQYPGAVGDLASSADGTRTYEPTSRSWYSAVVRDHAALAASSVDEALPHRPMSVTAPYVDRFGRGYVISIGGPVSGPDGLTVGVAGATMSLASLQEVVRAIQLRETGEAVLLYKATGEVVASRQLELRGLNADGVPVLDALILPGQQEGGDRATFGELTAADGSASGGSGALAAIVGEAGHARMSAGGAAYELVWQEVGLGDYAMVTCTRVDEILAPIADQMGTIRASAARVLQAALLICLACLLLVVLLVMHIARLISLPIAETVKQSNRIVANIGGDLFDGVTIEGRPADAVPTWREGSGALAGLFMQRPGEVAALRGEFLRVLYELNRKRIREPSPASPFAAVAAALPPSAPAYAVVDSAPTLYPVVRGRIQPDRTATEKRREGARLAAPLPPPLSKWNRLVSKIFFCLLLPTVVAMLLVVSTTTLTLWSDIGTWMAPVKAMMVREELASLDVRTYERAQIAATIIETSAGSLEVLHDVATQLLAEGSVPHGEPRVTHFSPLSLCPNEVASDAAFSCATVSTSACPRLTTSRTCAYSSSVTYRPPQQVPESIKSLVGAYTSSSEPGSGVSLGNGFGGGWLTEQRLVSQLDHALSAVYFASNVTYTYAAFHASETYRQFPYQTLDNYQGTRTCSEFPELSTSHYTPLCRPWYQSAINEPTGETVYNRVLTGSVYGETFLSLSRALAAADGSLIGVVAVDVGLLSLTEQIGGFRPSDTFTPSGVGHFANLYTRGYAMMWDETGIAVAHKNYLKEQNRGHGAMRVSLLDAGADERFAGAFEEAVVSRGRVTGNWTWPWLNDERGVYEEWHYSFRPVPGTPYMIALTVVSDEVMAVAEAAERRNIARVRASMWGSIAICGGILALLFAFTWYLNLRFAAPLVRLLRLVQSWGKSDFTGKVDAEDVQQASSWELSMLMSNFKKLLVAMRFGAEGWAKGDVDMVMQNNFAALRLVEESGNRRGMGVVLNNLALASADENVRFKFPQLEPREVYMAAIESGMCMLLTEPGNAQLMSTLAFRLLNCALYHMRCEPPHVAEAGSMIREVMKHCTDARTMATVCQHVSTDVLASGGFDTETNAYFPPDPTILSAMIALISAALTISAQAPMAHDDTDYLADLACAHCDIGCMIATANDVPAQAFPPPSLATWALLHIPTMSASTRVRLCLHAKAGAAPDFVAFVDAQAGLATAQPKGATGPIPLGGATAKWRDMTRGNSSLPRAMMFVLDLSYSMDGDGRLHTCKRSLSTILTEYLQPRDRVGLITFADDVREEFALGVVRPGMVEKVQALRTRGMTAFYSAVESGVRKLQSELAAEPKTPKWLIALTDGEDNRSEPNALNQAVQIIQKTPNLNVAVITVGDGINMTMVQQLLDAATQSGNEAVLQQANSQDDIARAFSAVSAAMGISEVL